jgi:hypothetical protein
MIAPEFRIYAVYGLFALIGAVQACASTPEPAPCDPASLAALHATCTSAEDCNTKLDQRQAHCAKVIEESP